MSNHQWTQARRLDDPAYEQYGGGMFYASLDVFGDASYAAPIVSGPPDSEYYFRAAFYTYTPAADQTLTVQTADTNGGDSFVFIYTRTAGAWQQVPFPQFEHSLASLPVTGGTTYYVMLAYGDDNPTGGQLVWLAFISAPPVSKDFDSQPIHVSISSFPRVPGQADEVNIPAVHPTLTIGVPTASDPAPPSGGPGDSADAPPITVRAGIAIPSVWAGEFTLSSPADKAVVVSSTPAFTVAVVADDNNQDVAYTAEIQYDDDPAFASPATLTGGFNSTDGGITLTPASAVPATTYWRARLLQAGSVVADFTTAQSFTVNAAVSATTIAVTWTVDSGADRPIHLWHINPPGPDIGDTITIYGQGFGSTGHLSFGDQLLDVLSWKLIPATDENTDPATRVIDGDTVTCEHYEVTFTAPVYDGPGAALSVEA